MTATSEAQARTHAFARVLGPYLVIVPGIIVARLNAVAPLAAPFFANPALVFIMGALMVFGGMPTISSGAGLSDPDLALRLVHRPARVGADLGSSGL